ncbi:hypothetical protein [Novipirellula sp.]|uniref:hypothetical protein n=1 Tax=Novipirellula sp. TaxID=2795430 RepID=UPI003565AD67
MSHLEFHMVFFGAFTALLNYFVAFFATPRTVVLKIRYRDFSKYCSPFKFVVAQCTGRAKRAN